MKGSPLSSRGVRSTPGWKYGGGASTLKGSPNLADGALFQSAVHPYRLSADPSDTTVIEKVTLSASMYQIPCSRGTIRETSEKRIKNSVPIIHDPERDRV